MIVIFSTGSVRLENSTDELCSCTRVLGESEIAGPPPFTVVTYNENTINIEKLTIVMAINNILKSSFYHNFDTKVYNVYVQYLNDLNVVFWCVDVNYF